MATVATTTLTIITIATLTTTPATTGTLAPWYRAALILPIAPSVTSPTTRRPERISGAMVSGILARESKKRADQSRSFFMLDTFTFILAARSVQPTALPSSDERATRRSLLTVVVSDPLIVGA